jgi:hypothetical protein
MNKKDIIEALNKVIDCFEIFSKLQWYQMGGRVAEQQCKDVLGVLKIGWATRSPMLPSKQGIPASREAVPISSPPNRSQIFS